MTQAVSYGFSTKVSGFTPKAVNVAFLVDKEKMALL